MGSAQNPPDKKKNLKKKKRNPLGAKAVGHHVQVEYDEEGVSKGYCIRFDGHGPEDDYSGNFRQIVHCSRSRFAPRLPLYLRASSEQNTSYIHPTIPRTFKCNKWRIPIQSCFTNLRMSLPATTTILKKKKKRRFHLLSECSTKKAHQISRCAQYRDPAPVPSKRVVVTGYLPTASKEKKTVKFVNKRKSTRGRQ